MKQNDFTKELRRIRLELYNETKDLTFEEKKQRRKKIIDEIEKKYGFKFKTASNEYDTSFSENPSMMVCEKESEYGKKE